MSRLLKVNDVAERLAYKPRTVYSQVFQGTFPIKALRIHGRTIRFAPEDVERYLQELRAKE